MATDASVVDFVRNTFGHLKAIAATAAAQPLLKAVGVLNAACALCGESLTAKLPR